MSSVMTCGKRVSSGALNAGGNLQKVNTPSVINGVKPEETLGEKEAAAATTREGQKERPILFSAPMVRAILDGRKTQTRRIIKKQPLGSKAYPFSPNPNYDGLWSDTKDPVTRYFGCPYGIAGDRLWVRETFVVDHYEYIPHGRFPKHRPDFILDEHIYYRATCDGIPEHDGPIPWRPSIHMPRWASRITLEITKVRVERLQEIIEDDAKAEGCEYQECGAIGMPKRSHVAGFAALWDSINGKGAWEQNPFVWVVEFQRLNP